MNTFKRMTGLCLLSLMTTSVFPAREAQEYIITPKATPAMTAPAMAGQPTQGYYARAKGKVRAGYEKAKKGAKLAYEHKGKVLVGASLAALLAYEMWYYYNNRDFENFNRLAAQAKSSGSAVYKQSMQLFNSLKMRASGARTYLPTWLGGAAQAPAMRATAPGEQYGMVGGEEPYQRNKRFFPVETHREKAARIKAGKAHFAAPLSETP